MEASEGIGLYCVLFTKILVLFFCLLLCISGTLKVNTEEGVIIFTWE